MLIIFFLKFLSFFDFSYKCNCIVPVLFLVASDELILGFFF